MPLVLQNKQQGIGSLAPPEKTAYYFYQTDPNGMPLRLRDEQGEVVWLAHYSTFGRVDRLYQEKVTQPLRLQGQYFDEESGLHYNRHRYYDPEVGVFISADPIGLLGGVNPYQYAVNTLGWIDPLGLSCKPNHKAGMSTKLYGHARNRHGSQKSEQSMRDRASSTENPQGHFSDNAMIEEAFGKAPTAPGVYDVKVSKTSNVYYPDGSTKTTDIVKVIISENKGPVTAFPYVLGD